MAGFPDQGHQRVAVNAQATRLGNHRVHVLLGAREQLLATRRKLFAEQYVDPMVAEASRLGIDSNTLVSLIRETSHNNGSRTR